jgi:signal transduction histidine kinase
LLKVPAAQMSRLEVAAMAYRIVTFTDSGPGIDPGDIHQLFTQFFRNSERSGSRHSGMGLGLYIAKEIVTQHGGDIHVDSELGKGSVFTVRLPLVTSLPTDQTDHL